MIIINNFNYVGIKKEKNYFEGWYLRIVDDNNNCYSFIFGISLNEEDPHSFIQIIDQSEEKTHYLRFKVSDFNYEDNVIKIKNNIISMNKLKLKVDSFDIDINITPTVFLEMPGGAMGFFKYFLLPVRHEIIFLNSKIEGSIKTKNKDLKIHGNAYMEKNFGSRFPKRWLWLQTNHFQKNDMSFVMSKADLIGNIYGFFCFLNVGDREYYFATYNCSKIDIHRNGNDIEIVLKKGEYILKIEMKWKPGHLIIGPTKKAKMEKKIEESLTSTLTLSLYESNKLILYDAGINVACEYQY